MFTLGINKEEAAAYQEELLTAMNSLYNLGFRLTKNREDASDLVQEASLRGLRYYHKYEKGTNFKGWILTILRNIFINEYRKRVKEPNKVSYEEVESFVPAPKLSGVQEEIFGEEVQCSIDGLSEELQTAITLFYVEGLSYKEMAAVMKCPVGTVMSRMHMARQLIKKKLTFEKTKKQNHI